jgi:hypothetical protein
MKRDRGLSMPCNVLYDFRIKKWMIFNLQYLAPRIKGGTYK